MLELHGRVLMSVLIRHGAPMTDKRPCSAFQTSHRRMQLVQLAVELVTWPCNIQ